MSALLRLKLAVAWENWRVPLMLLVPTLLLVGTYFEDVGRIEAFAALFLTPLVCVALAMRSLWHEAAFVRNAASLIALATAASAELAAWNAVSTPLMPDIVRFTLLGAAVAAAALQFHAARLRVKTFFAMGIGAAIGLGLYAPAHVREAHFAASVAGALAVAVIAGGGSGLAVVALADRFGWGRSTVADAKD